ncbi:hypothetical protein FAZ95_34545 [Trinickia violacea]|uniref:Uncharacterized protein n=1 Tax=Trinickia violacea TaxID=2571746 RepID=A0A4P8IXI2_9BURK|nr:hypothetical protein [Trinickia violacea]QCP54108.1 hypothetical protein FAZ95_34545 [Trinickia violacea]
MASTQWLKVVHAESSAPAQSVSRNNVIRFPSSQRILLPVSLHYASPEQSRAQIRALLHCPLGVYVAGIEAVRGDVRVLFDIAAEDFDFTLHTLIATLPQATIGRLSRRSVKAASSRA